MGYLYLYERPPPTKEELSIPGIKAKYSTPKYGVLQRSTLSLYKSAQESTSGGDPEQSIALGGCTITEMHVKHGAFDRSNYLRIFHPTRPFNAKGDRTLYLWCDVGYELERWYHALRAGAACAQGAEPDLRHVPHFAGASQACAALGGGPLSAVNALVHRVWWTLHREKLIEAVVIKEIAVVISRVPLPPIVKYLRVEEIHFGADVPLVTDARLTNFSGKGELTVDCAVDYRGGAVIRLACCVSVPVPNVGKFVSSTLSNVSSQIKGSTIIGSAIKSNIASVAGDAADDTKYITAALTIVVHVKKFAGKLRLMCLAPPSRTIWIGLHDEPVLDFAFDTILDASASSLVSSRIPMVTEAIASVVRTEITDILVLPQMDNIEIPDLEKLAGSSLSSSDTVTSSDSVTSSSSSSSSAPKTSKAAAATAAAAPPLPPKTPSVTSSLTSSADNSGCKVETCPPPQIPSRSQQEVPVRKAASMDSMKVESAPPRPPKAGSSLSTASMPPSGDEAFDALFPPVPRQRKVPSQQQNVD